jgi:hypothetical protein
MRTPTDREFALALGALTAVQTGRATPNAASFQSEIEDRPGSGRCLTLAVLTGLATANVGSSAPIYWTWRTEAEHDAANDTLLSIRATWHCYNPEVFTMEFCLAHTHIPGGAN